VTDTEILLVLGGSWHDFDGFAACTMPLLARASVAVRVSYDLEDLASLEALGCRIVVLYTCLDDKTSQHHTDPQTNGLYRWVNGGGGLLAIHSATIAARQHSILKSLIGGSFISHPPRATFIATPSEDAHPIIQGVESFAIEDELYTNDVNPSVQIHLVAQHQGKAQPLAWSRVQGKGKVAYLALGHDQAAWDSAGYQKIFVQSIGWLLTETPPERS